MDVSVTYFFSHSERTGGIERNNRNIIEGNIPSHSKLVYYKSFHDFH